LAQPDSAGSCQAEKRGNGTETYASAARAARQAKVPRHQARTHTEVFEPIEAAAYAWIIALAETIDAIIVVLRIAFTPAVAFRKGDVRTALTSTIATGEAIVHTALLWAVTFGEAVLRAAFIETTAIEESGKSGEGCYLQAVAPTQAETRLTLRFRNHGQPGRAIQAGIAA
jgi:hypothetical protein